LPIDSRVTFYSQHGEWFADACAVLLAVAVFLPLVGRLIRRRRKAPKATR